MNSRGSAREEALDGRVAIGREEGEAPRHAGKMGRLGGLPLHVRHERQVRAFRGAPARQGNQLAQVAVAAPVLRQLDQAGVRISSGRRQQDLAADDEVDAAFTRLEVAADHASDQDSSVRASAV